MLMGGGGGGHTCVGVVLKRTTVLAVLKGGVDPLSTHLKGGGAVFPI